MQIYFDWELTNNTKANVIFYIWNSLFTIILFCHILS